MHRLSLATSPQIADGVTSSHVQTKTVIKNNMKSYTNYKQSNESNEEKNTLYSYDNCIGIDPFIMAEIEQELTELEITPQDQHNCDVMSQMFSNKSTKQSKKSIKIKNKNKRKKSKAKKHSSDGNDAIGYEPNEKLRAKGNIKICKEMTEQIIVHRIKENISNVFTWMDKWSAFNGNSEFMDGKIRIFDYGFHDKLTNKVLYCVAEKQNKLCKASRGYQWNMKNYLFTIDEIEKQYKISIDKLPQSPHLKLKSKLKCNQNINNIIVQKDMLLNEDKINNTNWHKLKIYNRRNNKTRMVLYLSKPEFIKKLRYLTDSVKDINLIPILMFNSNTNDFWCEFIWIVRINPCVDIGISFKYIEKENQFKVSGIHLDKQYIQDQHELILPNHNNNNNNCTCLDGFESNINDLAIGNPDDQKNRMKYYKQQSEKQTIELQQQSDELMKQTAQLSQYKQYIKALEKQLMEKEKLINVLTNDNYLFQTITTTQLTQTQMDNINCYNDSKVIFEK